jgi:CheY-like chemotaxis protein
MGTESLRILLADDDESDRILFEDAFKELKISSIVHTVNNGIKLMDYLTKNNATLPHFIFLDLNMPRKNGLECVKDIRRNNKFKEIQIVIYSTSTYKNDIEESYHHGANMYLKKPSDFNILIQLLTKAISTSPIPRNQVFDMELYLLKI